MTVSLARTAGPDPRGAGATAAVALWVAGFLLLTAWRVLALDHLGLDLQVDEAQYWDWSTALSWGYFSKPPAIAALIAASTAVFGDGVLGVKALPALCWLATAGVVARLGWELGGPRVGTWAAAWFATTPAAVVLGLFATTDAPLMLCWALALWALWRVSRGGSWRAWVALGLCIGLGVLSKYTMAAFLVTAVGVLARRPRPAGPLLALALAGVIVAPNLAWNLSHGGATWRHTAELTVATAPTTNVTRALGDLAEFIAGQSLMLGPVLTVAVGLHLWRRRVAAPAARAVPDAAVVQGAPVSPQALCLWAALPLWAIGAVVAMRGGAQINWCAPALVGACLAIALAPSRASATRSSGAAWVLAGQVAVVALVLHWSDLARMGPAPLAAVDPFVRMRGWDQAFAELARASQSTADGPGLQAGDHVVGLNRTLMAQGRWAWRDRGLQWAAWPPAGSPRHHYELTRPWTGPWAPAPADATSWALSDGTADDHRRLQALGARPVAQAHRPDTRGRQMTLTLWRLPPGARPPR